MRSHWGIEKARHWTLEMALAEDRCRARKDHGPEDFALVRHIALNLLKQKKASKRGFQEKRLRAAWDQDYLLPVLAGFTRMVN